MSLGVRWRTCKARGCAERFRVHPNSTRAYCAEHLSDPPPHDHSPSWIDATFQAALARIKAERRYTVDPFERRRDA